MPSPLGSPASWHKCSSASNSHPSQIHLSGEQERADRDLSPPRGGRLGASRCHFVSPPDFSPLDSQLIISSGGDRCPKSPPLLLLPLPLGLMPRFFSSPNSHPLAVGSAGTSRREGWDRGALIWALNHGRIGDFRAGKGHAHSSTNPDPPVQDSAGSCSKPSALPGPGMSRGLFPAQLPGLAPPAALQPLPGSASLANSSFLLAAVRAENSGEHPGCWQGWGSAARSCFGKKDSEWSHRCSLGAGLGCHLSVAGHRCMACAGLAWMMLRCHSPVGFWD